MSNENEPQKIVDTPPEAFAGVEDRLTGIMADQQAEFEAHRVNVTRRLRDLERRRGGSSLASFLDFDFEGVFMLAAIAIASVVALKIWFALASKAGREGK
jgi:hypothetical protein